MYTTQSKSNASSFSALKEATKTSKKIFVRALDPLLKTETLHAKSPSQLILGMLYVKNTAISYKNLNNSTLFITYL